MHFRSEKLRAQVAHMYAVAAAGARFTVMPDHFVAAHEHDKSVRSALQGPIHDFCVSTQKPMFSVGVIR